ncbi:MAG: hypothetical protein NC102_04585 [Clostridium sp.]|nr:hypothetical protein [Clostridium sp.]
MDSSSGHAISTSGLELAFGSDWQVTDRTLMQSHEQISEYPKLEEHLAKGVAQFSEIVVDSVLFYNPHRGVLFVTYHQAKPLKPTSEISLYDEAAEVHSKEHARVFGMQSTYIDDDGWENGPTNSVYTNVHYRPKDKCAVLLQRIPFGGSNIAAIQILKTIPKKGNWWTDYPRGTFCNIDLGNPDNIEHLSLFLLSSRTLAVENLKLAQQRAK